MILCVFIFYTDHRPISYLFSLDKKLSLPTNYQLPTPAQPIQIHSIDFDTLHNLLEGSYSCQSITPSFPTVANTAAFIKSKKQQSFSRQLAAELSWVLVLAGLVWCTATSAHLGGATVATSVMRLRVKPRHHRCGYTHHSQSYVCNIRPFKKI